MTTSNKLFFLLLLGMLLLSACMPSETTVKIIQPTEGSKVDQFLTIDGESILLPEDGVIWVVIFLPSTGRYYPQNFPADIQANGEWTATTYIGQTGDSGLAADIIAVLADESSQAAFNSYLVDAKNKNDFPGMERMPEGATIYDRVSVVRK